MPRRPFLILFLFARLAVADEWKGMDRKIAEYYHFFPLESFEVLAYKMKYQTKLLTEVGCLFGDKVSDKENDPEVTDRTLILVPLRLNKGKPELVKPGNGILEANEISDDGSTAVVPAHRLFRPSCHVDSSTDPWTAKLPSLDDEEIHDDEDAGAVSKVAVEKPTPTPTPTATTTPTPSPKAKRKALAPSPSETPKADADFTDLADEI